MAGLRHLHLLVSDQVRSVAFYRAAFGMEVMFSDGDIVFLRSPGRRDDLALHQATTEEERARVGQPGGIEHFGISLVDRSRLGEAIEQVVAAGGELLRRGDHAPGVPFAYVSDPDGYVIEL
jgi:catechol 2,3-dioxygenase-like lactoylglutathione lyase family enzyme